MNNVRLFVVLTFALTFIFGMYQILSCWAKYEIYELIDKLTSKYNVLFKSSGLLEESLGRFCELCPNSSPQIIKESLMSLLECDSPVSNSMTLCDKVHENNFLHCSKPLVALFEDCLSGDSKGLPMLVLESVVSVLSFLCRVNGEQILELGNPCIYDMAGHELLLQKCSKEFWYKMQQLEHGAAKVGICSIWKDLRTCAVEKVDKSCGNVKTKEVFAGFTTAVLAPC